MIRTQPIKLYRRPALKDKNGKIIPLSKQEKAAKIAKEKVIYTGFIAQEVEQAAISLNYDFSGVDAPKNNKNLYGLRYSQFVMPVEKAVQELSKMNDEKDAVINELKARIEKLEAVMNAGLSGHQP